MDPDLTGAAAKYVRNDFVVATCANCHQPFVLRGQRLSQIRSDHRRNRPWCRQHKGSYCGRECARAHHHLTLSRWPSNPRGRAYCRAPVAGGCDGLRTRAGGRVSAFCMAHDKRRQRGRPLDTPIARRPHAPAP